MQISPQEVLNMRRSARRSESPTTSEPVRSVEELAARHGVRMDEVRRFTRRVLESEEDPVRERRVRDVAARVASGRYAVEDEQLVDMAERRALADGAIL